MVGVGVLGVVLFLGLRLALVSVVHEAGHQSRPGRTFAIVRDGVSGVSWVRYM